MTIMTQEVGLQSCWGDHKPANIAAHHPWRAKAAATVAAWARSDDTRMTELEVIPGLWCFSHDTAVTLVCSLLRLSGKSPAKSIKPLLRDRPARCPCIILHEEHKGRAGRWLVHLGRLRSVLHSILVVVITLSKRQMKPQKLACLCELKGLAAFVIPSRDNNDKGEGGIRSSQKLRDMPDVCCHRVFHKGGICLKRPLSRTEVEKASLASKACVSVSEEAAEAWEVTIQRRCKAFVIYTPVPVQDIENILWQGHLKPRGGPIQNLVSVQHAEDIFLLAVFPVGGCVQIPQVAQLPVMVLGNVEGSRLESVIFENQLDSVIFGSDFADCPSGLGAHRHLSHSATSTLWKLAQSGRNLQGRRLCQTSFHKLLRQLVLINRSHRWQERIETRTFSFYRFLVENPSPVHCCQALEVAISLHEPASFGLAVQRAQRPHELGHVLPEFVCFCLSGNAELREVAIKSARIVRCDARTLWRPVSVVVRSSALLQGAKLMLLHLRCWLHRDRDRDRLPILDPQCQAQWALWIVKLARRRQNVASTALAGRSRDHLEHRSFRKAPTAEAVQQAVGKPRQLIGEVQLQLHRAQVFGHRSLVIDHNQLNSFAGPGVLAQKPARSAPRTSRIQSPIMLCATPEGASKLDGSRLTSRRRLPKPRTRRWHGPCYWLGQKFHSSSSFQALGIFCFACLSCDAVMTQVKTISQISQQGMARILSIVRCRLKDEGWYEYSYGTVETKS